MSTKSRKKANQSKIAKFEEDFCRDNNVNDSVDSTKMSWISNLLSNQKTRQEIAKDIVDGILDVKEIEEIFPCNFVQELRQSMPEQAQNFLNGCKSMTVDKRMKGLLIAKLIRESSTEMLKLIGDRTPNFNRFKRFYPGRRAPEEEKKSNVAAFDVATSSEQLSPKNPINVDVNINKETNDLGAKKKRSTAKKDEKELNTKKEEKELNPKKEKKEVNTKKRETDSKKVPKKVARSVKPSKEKRSAEETSSTILRNRFGQEDFQESSLKSQGDRYETSTSKKMANSESLASEGEGEAKLTRAKKVSKKVGEDAKPRMRNKGKGDVKNLTPLLSKIGHDYTEESEKSKGDESSVKNENKALDRVEETRNDEGLENILQKSRVNQIASSISFLKDGEQDTRGSKEDEPRNVPEYNFNIQFDTSTPKKLNCESKMIRIKEEPRSEGSFEEFDHPIEEEKLLNGCDDFCKKEDYSPKKLPARNVKKTTNAKAKPSKSKKVSEVSKKMVNPAKRYGSTKKENMVKGAKNVEEKKGAKVAVKSFQERRQDRRERKRREKMQRREKKMQKAMTKFSGEVIKLVKDMGYLESSEESDESSSSCCCSEESSDESSYSSSTEESCSCSSCCDSSSSNEYSEYTLCSCSNCGSSCSDDLSSSSNSDEINEE